MTLTIGSATPGVKDRKGIPTTTYIDQPPIPGCSVQPVQVKEDVTNIDYTLGKFNVFMPPAASALACKATDHITDPFGTVYRVIGAKTWFRNGQPHHVTAVAEIPNGLDG